MAASALCYDDGVSEETSPSVEDETAPVEIARALDRLEATIWVRFLEERGFTVTTEKKGGWLRALLYLGRVPVAVLVPGKEAVEAKGLLKKSRFI
jgi:hypothetical protein